MDTKQAAILGMSAVALLVGTTTVANASLILVAAPGFGVSLSDILVGQTFELDEIGEGSSGEHIESGGGGYSVGSPNLTLLSIVFGPNFMADISTNPVVYEVTVEANAVGPAYYQSIDTSFTTNITNYTSDSLSTNILSFSVLPAIAVPEPDSLVLTLTGIVAIVYKLRRRHTRAKVARTSSWFRSYQCQY